MRVKHLLRALMEAAVADGRDPADCLAGLGCTLDGYQRGIARFAHLLPQHANDACDDAWTVFALAFAIGEADASLRLSGSE